MIYPEITPKNLPEYYYTTPSGTPKKTSSYILLDFQFLLSCFQEFFQQFFREIFQYSSRTYSEDSSDNFYDDAVEALWEIRQKILHKFSRGIVKKFLRKHLRNFYENLKKKNLQKFVSGFLRKSFTPTIHRKIFARISPKPSPEFCFPRSLSGISPGKSHRNSSEDSLKYS